MSPTLLVSANECLWRSTGFARARGLLRPLEALTLSELCTCSMWTAGQGSTLCACDAGPVPGGETHFQAPLVRKHRYTLLTPFTPPSTNLAPPRPHTARHGRPRVEEDLASGLRPRQEGRHEEACAHPHARSRPPRRPRARPDSPRPRTRSRPRRRQVRCGRAQPQRQHEPWPRQQRRRSRRGQQGRAAGARRDPQLLAQLCVEEVQPGHEPGPDHQGGAAPTAHEILLLAPGEGVGRGGEG
jgi:hypothetical protein